METAFGIVVMAGGVGGFVLGLWLVFKLGETRSVYAGIPRWHYILGYLLPFVGMGLGVVATYELLRWLG